MPSILNLTAPTLKDYTKENIIATWSGVEAGYVNDPNDRGGETNHGVTIATANQYRAALIIKFGWSGQMRDLTAEMAYYIYDLGWWQPMRCDDLLAVHPFVCDRVFDLAINGGRTLGVKTLQRILNACNRQGKDYADIGVDGGIGTLTLNALKGYVAKRGYDGVNVLVQYQFSLQGAHYIELAEKDPTQENFVNGWGDRITKINALYQRVLLNSK